MNRLSRYQLLQRYMQNFWLRWRQDYLKQLTRMHRAVEQQMRNSLQYSGRWHESSKFILDPTE
uniref:DUF5641 domain-containing protein n=1 Tax=Anopheles stephensi TaxID=30069 RepID=A0A182YRC0_ANOST